MAILQDAALIDVYCQAAIRRITQGEDPLRALLTGLLGASVPREALMRDLTKKLEEERLPGFKATVLNYALLLFGAARAGAEPTFPPPEGETAWVSTDWVHGAVVASTTDKGARIYSGMVISGAPEEYFPIEAAKAQRVYEEYRERSVAIGHDPGPGEYLWLFGRNKRRP